MILQEYADRVFNYGFLITEKREWHIPDKCVYLQPWSKITKGKFDFYIHPRQKAFFSFYAGREWFLIGHAYDPFDGIAAEQVLLDRLAEQYDDSSSFFDTFNQLTGIFLMGYIDAETIFLIHDAAGMQTVFYGTYDGKRYIASHTQLLGDVLDLKPSDYVQRLIHYRWYSFFGRQLPGDLSPYTDFKRLIPNHYVLWTKTGIQVKRFFPTEVYSTWDTDAAYDEIIQKIGEILCRSMELIPVKWDRPAVSLTGGCDSKTTLSCVRNTAQYQYFSYISSDAERIDAEAAHEICRQLDLPHTIYHISDHDTDFQNLEVIRELLRKNTGNIGEDNRNDVRKRAYFLEHMDFDVEVKSWASEIGRAYYNKRFAKKSFPSKPTARYMSGLYKVFLQDRRLLRDTDAVFRAYTAEYMSAEQLLRYPWQEIFFWEFRMSAWNGLVISGEHRLSYDITIPYNNRKLLDWLLRVPLKKRITDTAYADVRSLMNPTVDAAGIAVTNVKHTGTRAIMERIYLEISARLPF